MERTILEALGYYLIRLVMFGATGLPALRLVLNFVKTKTQKKKQIQKIKVNPYDWQKT